MKKKTFLIKEKVWVYRGPTAWHFVSLPKALSLDIKKEYRNFAKGWGSLPVIVTLGKTVWNTSIFPDSKSGEYLLPIKASVRKKEGVWEGDILSLKIKLGV